MADQAFFKCRVGDKSFELDKLTLGEARTLKRDFDLKDLGEFSPTDPDVLVGLLFLALKREQPSTPDNVLLKQIEDLDINSFEVQADEPAEADPTPEAVPATASEVAAPVEAPAGA